MFNWLSKCWGGVGVTSQFEKARLACTHSDWDVPEYSQISLLIKTFKDQNTEMGAQAAINSLFSHFEQDDQKQNPAFILKNLLILDIITEQRLFLNKIHSYYNGKLLYMDSNKLEISSSMQQLISSYYVYIKQKAKLYMDQELALLQHNSRKQYISSMPPNRILMEVNICFKIQNLILAISDKYINGNKSPLLIQQIFSFMLKTFLFCYSIVALGVQTFTKKMTDLGKTQLQHFYKLARFFNKEYTRNFLLFIQRNKNIENFKKIKYNQMIIMDDRILDSINKQLIILNEESHADPLSSTVKNLPFSLQTKIQVQNVAAQDQVDKKQVEVEGQWRIPLKTNKSNSKQKWPVINGQEQSFTNYQNFYSQFFITESSQFTAVDDKKQDVFDFKLKDTAILYSDLCSPTLKKQLSIQGSNKFDKQVWNSWQNTFTIK